MARTRSEEIREAFVLHDWPSTTDSRGGKRKPSSDHISESASGSKRLHSQKPNLLQKTSQVLDAPFTLGALQVDRRKLVALTDSGRHTAQGNRALTGRHQPRHASREKINYSTVLCG